LLNGRTGYRTIGTKHAAVARLRTQNLTALFAFIKEHTRIVRHRFCFLMAAVRTRNDRFIYNLTTRRVGGVRRAVHNGILVVDNAFARKTILFGKDFQKRIRCAELDGGLCLISPATPVRDATGWNTACSFFSAAGPTGYIGWQFPRGCRPAGRCSSFCSCFFGTRCVGWHAR